MSLRETLEKMSPFRKRKRKRGELVEDKVFIVKLKNGSKIYAKQIIPTQTGLIVTDVYGRIISLTPQDIEGVLQ